MNLQGRVFNVVSQTISGFQIRQLFQPPSHLLQCAFLRGWTGLDVLPLSLSASFDLRRLRSVRCELIWLKCQHQQIQTRSSRLEQTSTHRAEDAVQSAKHVLVDQIARFLLLTAKAALQTLILTNGSSRSPFLFVLMLPLTFPLK